MIKLKKLINERKFGEPLPTLKSEIEKHQSKKVVTEDVETAVDMLMKRWKGVVAYWEDIDEIWKIKKWILAGGVRFVLTYFTPTIWSKITGQRKKQAMCRL